MPTGYKDYQEPVDIVAQTLSDLQVDIVAQTLDKMGIDVKAQTISDLDMNIKGQTLGEVIQFPKYGPAYSAHGQESTLVDGDDLVLVNYDGQGQVYHVRIRVKAATDSHLVKPLIRPDVSLYVYRDFKELNDIGYTTNSPFIQLLKYSVDGNCVLTVSPGTGITYTNNLTVSIRNNTGTTQSVEGQVLYTKQT